MQVTETHADGLMRQIQVVVPAQELNERCDKRLDEIQGTVEIRGFRKGKVPRVHLKKVYGRRLMAEVVENAVEESSKQALDDRNERPATRPEISLPEDEAEIEGVVSGTKDLSYSMKYEVIPPIELVDFASLEIERVTADVEDEEITEKLNEIAQRHTLYDPHDTAAAEDGDKLTIDFVGRIDGEAFDGGTADDVNLVIGEGGFIAGFEDGLKGAAAGETRVVTTTFPEDYPVETLQSKEAVFDVTVKEVGKPRTPELNDEFAQSVGMDDLDGLRNAIETQLASEYERIGRARLKRQLLDALDDKHSFELPSSLCDVEFDSIWQELTNSMEKDGKSFEEMDKPEDELRTDYLKLAERRVRLGLVIGEIGERFGVQVEKEELREAIVQQARRFPGQERQVYEYFEKTPGAINQLRAPVFEEKVVDLLLDKVNVTDRKVSRSEFLKLLEEDDEDDNIGVAPGNDA